MTITLANLQGYVQHVLSGGRLSSPLPGADDDEVEKNVINMAGQWFVSHHPWNWRIRPELQLSTVADQNYIDMPNDFGEMIAYQVVSGLNYGIELTTPQIIADRRASSVTISQNYYWGAFSHPTRSGPTEAPGPPRFELWPTPGSAITDFMRLWYRSEWAILNVPADVAEVPDYCEFALAMACRAFASGLCEEYVRERDVMSELDKLVNSELFKTCKQTDGLQQTDYGHLAGGAIQGQYSPSWRSASASPVADPS